MNHGHFRRYFCCCIPTRIAVLLLSFISILASLGNAAAIFFTLRNFENTNGQAWYDLDTASKVILIVYGVFSVIYALSSLSGFIGAIVRSRKLVGIYVFVSWVMLLLSTALGSLAIWAAFKDKSNYQQACVERVNSQIADGSQITADACDGSFKVALGIVIGVFVISVLIHLYLCIIIRRYKEQLDDEHQYQRGSSYAAGPYGVVGNRGTEATYVPVTDVEKGHRHSQPPNTTYTHGNPYATPHYA
ncbi:hypothetical protein OC846_005121 [Tilletia horrida]|uniref:Uncharacterized protein n=1 Tax=Tilletia horrida TaxID=155126 RepID=A0AAN6JS39_9BASI|nr:hypothetical protein OC846_005121 [Tilletia horrida]KAK0553751.1 hypothetical protein OC845_001041 [Tilletia horrida]KAK0562403.1 hypothetical protein OC861_005342 [Tilletia horrida]